MCTADIFLGILAILFPPLPVWVKCGICSADSLINILLCLLGFLPGLLHAWYIIAKNPEPPYEYESLPQDGENGNVRYVIVRQQPGRQQPAEQQRGGGGGINYGTQGTQTNGQQGRGNGEGGSNGGDGVPPSYAEVVAAGDHKVQSRD